MSGPKCSTVRYVPTEQDVRASNERTLEQLRSQSVAFALRIEQLEVAWRERAPEASKRLVQVRAPLVVAAGNGRLDDEVVAARGAMRQSEMQLSEALSQCAAEEAKRIARRHADATEVAAARAEGSGSALRDVTRDRPIEFEESVGSSAAAHAPHGARAQRSALLPDVEVRADRAAAILARSAHLPIADRVSSLRDVVDAESVEAFDAALQRARALVDAADAHQREVEDARRFAMTILDSFGSLDDPGLETWRPVLLDAIAEGRRLSADEFRAMDQARSRAVRARLAHVLRDAGCRSLADEGDVLVGYIDQGEGTATKVLVDDEGVLVTPVATRALSLADAHRLEEKNCQFDRELARAGADVGLVLQRVSERGFGEIPVRIESVPWESDESENPDAETDSRQSDRQSTRKARDASRPTRSAPAHTRTEGPS